jgi:hypothetical protein
VPEANVYQCNDCGAYAEDPREVQHHSTCIPGESEKWEEVYKYEDVLPIDSYQSTVWLIEFPNGCQQLHVWHKDAKIEDIVDSVKVHYPDLPFTVAAIDVGMFTLHSTHHSLSNGRKLNQNKEVVV